MDTKHTPGPWIFYSDTPSTDPDWHIVTNASRRRVVANVHIEPGNEMALANAHLIAAAPDLFAVANAAMQCIGELPPTQARAEVMQMLQSAIAKPTGE